MPDSIFSAHEQRYAREEGTLRGAEVIAVNGIPVREARHAAELVAGCKDEVRLTIRRVGVDGGVGSVVEKRVEPIVEEEETVKTESLDEMAPMPQSMPPSMGDVDDGPNKTISFDDESEMSVKTEEENKDNDEEVEQQQQHQNDEPDWSDQKSTKSQDIIERRRQIAQSMIMSTEMVEDPIPSPGEHFSGGQVTPTAAESASRPPSTRNAGSASAIERRRLAAMEMYQSQEMVVDNVDDTRLGTIDAISPRDTIDPISSFKTNNDPFGDNASVATTNITTSSVATQRMGSNNIKEFFNDAFSPTNAAPLQSPQAQRRKERAMQRISRSNSFSRTENNVSQSTTPTNANSPTALRSPVANTEALPKYKNVTSNVSAHSASQIRKNKTDDESVAAASITASSVAASTAAASTAAISETSGESRGSRSLFGKKKKQPLGSSVTQTVPTKKKSSLFGVANLIRKVNVRPNGITRQMLQLHHFSFSQLILLPLSS